MCVCVCVCVCCVCVYVCVCVVCVCVLCRTEDALGELLREIERHSSSVRFEAMANILAIHCQSDGEHNTTHSIYNTHCIGLYFHTFIHFYYADCMF